MCKNKLEISILTLRSGIFPKFGIFFTNVNKIKRNLMFQTMRLNDLTEFISLKYKRSTKSGCKNIGIR